MVRPFQLIKQDGLAIDSRSLEGLKSSSRAAKGSEAYEASLNESARQFEAVFLQWMLKSMRQANPDGGLLNSSALQSFRGMYDRELVQALSGKGLGLASEIKRQLSALSEAEGESPLTFQQSDRYTE